MNSDFCFGAADWTRRGREVLAGSLVLLFMAGLDHKSELRNHKCPVSSTTVIPGLARLKSRSERTDGWRWANSRPSLVSEENRSPGTTNVALPSLTRSRSDLRMAGPSLPPSP